MKEPEEIKKLYDKLTASENNRFPEKGAVEISDKQGVYIIYSSNNEVLHVGRTKNGKNGINQRLKNHLNNQSSFSKSFLRPNLINLRSGCKFQFIEVECARKRVLLEALATGLLRPAHIGTGVKE